MSLKEEERKTLVLLEIERAERLYSEYEGLVEKGYWNTLTNRLYYALFHAVSAILIRDGRQVGSHKGAAIRFHQYYVRTGVFTPAEGSFYSQMETLREKADYNCFFDITQEEAMARIAPTRQLLDKIKQHLSE